MEMHQLCKEIEEKADASNDDDTQHLVRNFTCTAVWRTEREASDKFYVPADVMERAMLVYLIFGNLASIKKIYSKGNQTNDATLGF